jgi:hypothetical protein
MSKTIAILLAACLAAPLAAEAAGPQRADVSAAFGNTLLTIDPDGRSRKIWLEPDGTWTGLSRRGLDLAGKWTVNGEKVCLTQAKPRLPGSMCEAFPTQPGVSVQTRDPQGRTIQLKLVKGRVTK